MKKNPDKFRVTGIGFQSTNGKSLIDFPKASKTFDFINFLVKIRIKNSNNPYIKSKLNNVLNNINIDETHLKTVLETDHHDKTELKHIIDDFFTPQKNLNIEQIKKKMKIILENENKKNQSRIDRLKRENIVKNLNNCEIISQLKKETKIIIILDNYPVHKAQLVQKASKILNIQLILLPPYSPKLNPIEQVWRIIKRELSKIYIKDKTFLIQKFKSNYNEIVGNKTFYAGWIKKFIKTNC